MDMSDYFPGVRRRQAPIIKSAQAETLKMIVGIVEEAHRANGFARLESLVDDSVD